jgi:WS/DGAT/MGAT family acyltransferase
VAAQNTTGDPREWAGGREMTPLEALIWRAEADPMLRSHMTAIEVLDRVPDWDRLLAAHEWATSIVPRFRERVVETPFNLAPPVWAVDREFDLTYHLRRVALPAPGRLRDLLDFAQALAMAPLDRSRPQWEATLVEGLESGQAAYVLKLNHALTDGLGAIQLFGMIHSPQREATPDKVRLAAEPADGATGLAAITGRVADRVAALPGDGARGVAAGAALARCGLCHPRSTVADAARYAGSLSRVLTPPRGHGSPLLEQRGRSWWFDAHEVPLADLRAAAKSSGGTVNDAFLAALLGAMRRYHEHFDVAIDELPMSIPISVRGERDAPGGNRIAPGRLLAPVGEPDPARRIRMLAELVAAARAEPAIDAFSAIAPIASRLPAALLTRLSRSGAEGNDLQASNVRGLDRPAYIAGARVTHLYPFGPLPGCAAMVTLVSHAGTCCIGANVDRAAITDTQSFARCLREGFAEVLALAARAPVPTPIKETLA